MYKEFAIEEVFKMVKTSQEVAQFNCSGSVFLACGRSTVGIPVATDLTS